MGDNIEFYQSEIIRFFLCRNTGCNVDTTEPSASQSFRVRDRREEYLSERIT